MSCCDRRAQLVRCPSRLGPAAAMAAALATLAVCGHVVAARAQGELNRFVNSRLLREDQWPLRTWERYIVDNRNDRVKWACVNWAGAYMDQHTVLGLDRRHIDDIAQRISELGFNCVRLPFSTEGVVENPVVLDRDLSANPHLQGGKRMLDLFDAAVEALTKQNLMVIINNHNSKSGWCCAFDSEEGLWYTPHYNESQWLQGLVTLAERYKDNKYVVAFDVRNEPHDYGGVGLTWGDGDPKTDWALAAKRAGDRILTVNPNVLIVIEALCLAKDLRPMRNHQVQLIVPNRVVYEVHAYHYFQMYSMWSDMFMSWVDTRRLAMTFALIPILIIAICLRAWTALRCIRPPPGVLATSVGTWVFLLSFSFVVFHIGVWQTMRTTSCSVGATGEQLPCILFWCVPSLVGLCIFLCGYEYHCGARCVKRWLHDHRQIKACCCDNRGESPTSSSREVVGNDFAALSTDDESEASEAEWSLCCWSKDFESWRVAVKVMRGDMPEKVAWDSGLCCGLQCFIFAVILLIAMVGIYVFAYIATSYWWFQRHHDHMWGFALIQGHEWTAPVWVGEFGTSAARGNYWLQLLHYMSARDVDWAYWVLNPEKPLTEEYVVGQGWVRFKEKKWVNETWGILESDWERVRFPWKMLDLARVMNSPGEWVPEDYPCDRSIYGSECGG